MKKQLIGTAVAALILFIWQFLSWTMLPTHKSEYGYTANQDKILEVLGQNLPGEGNYFLPMPAPGASEEEAKKTMESSMGKPWAQVSYHKAFEVNMGMNMFRGFAVDAVAAFLLIWLLMQMQNLNMMRTIQASVAVGVISYLTIPYLNSIWFENDSLGHLVDALVSWGLVGAWLGWWLNRP
ncbi:MAG: hypothetical protein JNJ57_14135 [Saprospiraceae bacterium]|nr:hypothetical protein [Saprospiraceae bacterium]